MEPSSALRQHKGRKRHGHSNRKTGFSLFWLLIMRAIRRMLKLWTS
jgi:hypothetical protein